MAVGRRFTSFVTAVLVAGSTTAAAAQESAPAPTEAVAEIGGRLRSFYFNLARHDWEALTADILAAKVVAHRPPPESRLIEEKSLGLTQQSPPAACSGSKPFSVEQAIITIEGDWAEVTVPHCAPVAGRDEFRLIRFDGRWRFVAVHLLQQPAGVTFGR